MFNGLVLPNDGSDTWHGIILYQCGKLFGEEFGAYCDSALKKIDEKWFENLKTLRKEFSINMSDPSFLFKECLQSDSPFRKILPNNPTFYNEISVLKRIRNKNQHYEFAGGKAEVKSAVKLYFDISLELNLSQCVNEFSKLLKRIDDIQSGKTFGDSRDLENKLQLLDLEKREIEKQKINQSEEIKKTQELIDQKNLEIQNLQKINSEKDSMQTVMTASLAGLKEEIFNLEEQLKMQTSEEASRRVSESDVESLINTLISRLSKEQIKAITSPNNQDSEIGKTWFKPKGKVKITLSVGKKDLLDPKTKEPVDFIEENLRLELAKDWLKIRPTGGRVFLDNDGNVSTVIDEDLIFLGKISTESSRLN